MDQEFDLRAQDELLSEQLTGDELREVLERLGENEFALNEFSTVRDVAEGTGAAPVAIGRALAEVRKQDFEERFASAFGEHEKRISKLEGTPRAGRLSVAEPSTREALAFLEVERLSQQQRRHRAQLRTRVITVVVLLLTNLLVLASFWYFYEVLKGHS